MKAFAVALLGRAWVSRTCLWAGLFLGPALAGAATFNVTNTLDGGEGSLRQAILLANSNPGADVIAFNIPGAGARVLQPLTDLPPITDPVRIDGTTQPGYAGSPLIEISGDLGTNFNGLRIESSNSVVAGLAITRFVGVGAAGLVISGPEATGNWIYGNQIGLDASGANIAPNYDGIVLVNGAHHNLIGTDGNGASDVAERNIISGQVAAGVILFNACSNRVAGNFIGTDRTGSVAMGNSDGIYVDSSATGNILGTDSSDDPFNEAERNVISGNHNRGAVLQGANRILGNYIGTDAAGTLSVPNEIGIRVSFSASNTVIGSASAAGGNLISGNTFLGIGIENGAFGSVVQGNRIGTDATGTNALGNGLSGILVSDVSGHLIGGTDAGAGNVIAFNQAGVQIIGDNALNIAVLGNSIFANIGLGLDLGADGVTLNDDADPDNGPNRLQNYPVLISVMPIGGSTVIHGTLNSIPGGTFRVELFANNAADPSGYGEGQTFLGTTTVMADGAGNGSFSVVLGVLLPVGKLVTATATHSSGGTSEFSPGLAASPLAPLSNQEVLAGQTVLFQTTDLGAAASYQWTLNGTVVAGQTNFFLMRTNVDATAAGTYCVRVSGTFGSATNCATLVVLAPPAITVQPVGGAFGCGSNFTLNVTATGTGPLNFQWRLNLEPLSGETNATLRADKVCEAVSDEYNPGGSEHALLLPGISTNLIFTPTPGSWVENPDGTATLTGMVRSRTNSSCGFNIDLHFSGRTSVPPPGSPRTDLDAAAYIPNGPVDPSTWNYYPVCSGRLTAFGICWDGAVLDITRTGPAWQVGAGANQENIHFGASGSFRWTVTTPRLDGPPLPATGIGDFNIDIKPCAPECPDCVVHYAVSLTASPGTAGDYEVVVSSPFGSVTSVVATVTVFDTTPPVITCASNRVAECGTAWSFNPPTAIDICDGTNVLITILSTTTNALVGQTFSATRVWRATDSRSNSSVCGQTVTSVDTTPPGIVCSTNITVQSAGPSSTTVTFDITASDICDTNVQVVCTPPAGSTFAPGISVVRCVGTDDSGNTNACTFTVQVQDTATPTNTLVWIFPGTFMMGSPGNDLACGTNETPRSSVTLTRGFWMSKYEVTQGDYLGVMGSNPSRFTGDMTRPVEQVSWTNAVVYCRRLTAREDADGRLPAGYEYRLPSEAEWEYAARAGTTTHWSFGDANADLLTHGWFILNSGCQYTNDPSCNVTGSTHPVGTKLPNPWGLYDMHGNVAEWCLDFLGTYQGGSVTNPVGPAGGSKIFRAPAWDFGDIYSRSACRWGVSASGGGDNSIGFRVVLAPLPPNVLVAKGAVWKFLDNGTEQGTAWRGVNFDDSGWASGPAQLGYGDGDEATVVGYGPDLNNKYITTYFRRSFAVADASIHSNLVVRLLRDDGGVVYLNGTEVFRSNMPLGPIAYRTLAASRAVGVADESVNFYSGSVPPGLLRTGNNVVAVEIHQFINTSTDISLDLELVAAATNFPPTITRQPQSVTVLAGSTVTFSVTAGGDPPLSYQWLLDGDLIVGATHETLGLVNVQAANAGDYQVVVMNPGGAITSDNATLTVHVPPRITTQPMGRTPACGNSFTLSVTAAGTAPLAYQWRRDAVALAGSINATLTLNASPVTAGDYTVVITNLYGAVTSLVAVVTVDSAPPVITCASNLVVECGTQWNFGAPVAFDIIDGTNVTITIVSTTTNRLGFCGNTFIASRVWQAVDRCGNSAQCSQTATVRDTTPPVLVGLPPNSNYQCLDFVPLPPAVTAIDNCDVSPVVTFSATTNGFAPQIITRIWTASDSCSNNVSRVQTIIVNDTVPPVLLCASDRVVECDTAWNFNPPVVLDNCDGTNVSITFVRTVTNTLCGTTYSATRTWLATDSCTNSAQCSQTITIVDTMPPVISCVSARVVECGTAWSFNPPSATDICDGTNVTITLVRTVTNMLCGTTYSATRTWLATDSCANSAQCSQTITIVDTTPPVVSCVSARVVECGTAWSFNSPSATDICDGTNVTITIVSTVTNGLIGQTYAATRTWRATDSCANSSVCSQSVTIVDTTPPAIACSTDITVECVGPLGKVVTFITTASDICDTNLLLVCTPPAGSTFALGLTTVRCVATDDSGNTNSCSFTVRVRDTTPPTISCPASIIAAEFPHDAGTAVVTFAAPVASDICDNSLAAACAPPSGAAFPVGYTTVLCTARDHSSNSSTCSFLIRVIPYRLSVTTVTTANDSGPGSFRQALLDANDAPGENLVVFNLAGGGPRTIHLLSPLPVVASPVIIDGWSQPGFSGIPLVELDGSGAGGADGLVINAGNSTVRGLALNGFATAIRLQTNGGNMIRGNFIGISAAGTNAPGNSGDGIHVSSASNVIGGTGANERNVIAASGGSGIHFDTTGAVSNLVVGNFIGMTPDGSTPAGNGLDGVRFSNGAARNTVGGTGLETGNLIAFNGRNGVALDPTAGTGNAIRGNSISANAALGIDLRADGVTANDPGDLDLGPNRLQNFPVLIDVRSEAGVTTIDGTLDSMGNATYRLDFFLNDTTDPTGFGEGAVYLGSTNVIVDASGSQAFSASFGLTATYLQFVTATATDPGNNTSEFSERLQVRTPPILEVQPIATNAPPGAPVALCAEASGTPPFFYQWRLNGENIPGATNACYMIPAAQVADGGVYNVIIINGLGVGQSGQAPLSLPIPILRSGDNFADAVLLTGTNGLVSWNNRSATSEPGEPKHAGKPGGKSVWYKWTVDKTGITTVGTRGSAFDTLLGVYEGISVSNLTSVAYDEDRGGFFTSGVRFNALKHHNYYIAIDGFGATDGDFAFGWSHEKTKKLLPSLDTQPESQTVASGGTARFTVLSDCICGEGHHHKDCDDWEPHECDEDDDGHLEHRSHPHPDHRPPKVSHQWFFNGVAIPGATDASLIISNVQPVNLGTYTVQASTRYRTIESQDAVLQINDSGLEVQQVQAMDKFLDAALAPVQFRLGNTGGSLVPGAGGFQPAAVVRGYTGTQTFNSTNARSEITEPSICGVAGGASEWITIVMEETGTLFINTDGSSYDTVIAVFRRNPMNFAQLQLLACDNTNGIDHLDSALSVPVEAGKTNYLMVDGVNGLGGVLKLNLSLVTRAMLSSRGFTNSAHKLRVSTHANARFAIQASPDLVNWTTLLTTNTPTSLFDFIDSGSVGSPRRFYRTQMLP